MNKQDIITLWASFWISADDALLILQKIMEISSKNLFLLNDIDDKYKDDIKSAFQQRKLGIPLEHILWETEFYGNRFFVSKDTLIPRNDTEILVEKAIEFIKQQKKISLADIWTGTGCIPISILKETWEYISNAFAVDISPEALTITKQNVSLHWLDDKIEVFQWDLFTPLENKKFHHLVVTANLPYILDNDIENMDKETIDYEPHLALFGGQETWFELYEKLVNQLQSVKAESITLFIEIGFDQGQIVRDFCNERNISLQIYKDNWWIERCVELQIR